MNLLYSERIKNYNKRNVEEKNKRSRAVDKRLKQKNKPQKTKVREIRKWNNRCLMRFFLFTAGNMLKVFTFRLRNVILTNIDLNGKTRSKTNDFATG